MDALYSQPFVEAVDSVFRTMLQVRPKRNGVAVKDGANQRSVLTSIVGLSGGVSGVVALRFPPDTALRLAGRMLGSERTDIDEEVVDALAELVNMVAGSAKAKLQLDPPLQLGLPTVVAGTGYTLKYPSRSVWLEVPFSSDAGDFSIEVTYDPSQVEVPR